MSIKSKRFSNEARESAIRLVLTKRHEYRSLKAAVVSLAPEIGCAPQTLYEWIRKHGSVSHTAKLTSAERQEKIQRLEHEIRQLIRANQSFKESGECLARLRLHFLSLGKGKGKDEG